MKEDEIRISINTIEERLSPGKSTEGKFRISAPAGKRIRGFVFSDHARIVTDLEQFTGREIDLRYGIDGTGLSEGDEIDGNIILATDEGEYKVPVHAVIRVPLSKTSYGKIRTLKDFSELALRNYEEAFKIYKNPAFSILLKNEDSRYLALYKGLGSDPVTRQKMEEFMVVSGMKKPTELKLIGTRAEYYDVRDSAQYTATLRRTRWGYISLTVSSTDQFIELPVTHISEDDFVGSICDVPYIINAEKLGRRRRTGTIWIRGSKDVLRLDITASGLGKNYVDREVLIQHRISHIMRALLKDCTERMESPSASEPENLKKSGGELLRKLSSDLEAIRQLGGDEIRLSLLEAYLRRRSGQQKEAIGLLYGLKKYDFKSESFDVQGAYLYLCTEAGLAPEKNSRRNEKIREWALRMPESFLLMHLTYLTDPEIRRAPIVRMKMIRKTFAAGCRSPFLYAEALGLILSDDSLLTSYDRFFRQVLSFAVKQNLMTKELALRAAYLSGNEKKYRPVTYRILSGMYSRYPENAILEALCRILIKGPSRDSRCFLWYSLALEQNLKITRLYEYYIETIPESWQKVLPVSVRKYFIYNDTLSGQNRAWLYANIVRNRIEDPDTFRDYREKIALFAGESLRQRQMNADYAAIYQEFFQTVTDSEMADLLADLIFTEQIFCDDKNIRRVVAVHRELEKEESSPLVRGRTFLHSYTDQTELFFEDAKGSRFRSEIAYSTERLMDPHAYAAQCLEKGSRKDGLILYALNQKDQIEAGDLAFWQSASESSGFSEEFRNEIRKKLLGYYASNTSDYMLKGAVESIDDREYVKADKALLTEVLLGFGLYERAFQLISTYGSEHVEDSQLVLLCCRMIEEKKAEEEENLVLLCMTAWKRRKFDERILSYLVQYFNGSIEDMILLRKDAVTFFVETFPLDQRILVRIMFSRLTVPEGPEFLRHYIEKGGQWRLAREYIVYESGIEFDRDEKVNSYLGLCLREMYAREPINFLLKMTLLRFYSEQEQLSVSEEAQADALLQEAEKNGLVLKCFQNLPKSFLQQYQLEDKVIIETHADPEDRVILHYRLDATEDVGHSGRKKQKRREEFRAEPLECVYRGIFQKVFTLFYGERLTGYLTVIHGETEESGTVETVTNPFADMSGRSRYQRINQMLKSLHDNQTEQLREQMTDYRKDSLMMEYLFSLQEEIQ